MRRLENHVSGVPLKELYKKREVSPQHHLFFLELKIILFGVALFG